jgi:hypothetical protein
MFARLRRRRLFGYSSGRTAGERRSACVRITFNVLVVHGVPGRRKRTVSPLALSVVTPIRVVDGVRDDRRSSDDVVPTGRR